MTDPILPPPAGPTTETVRDQDKMMLVLCYLGILGLVPYAVVKDSPYVHWHARQGLTLSGLAIGAWFSLAILGVMLRIVHLWVLLPLIGLGSLALLVGLVGVWILAVSKAVAGERWRIPIVADVADHW
ncbi:MAG: hypothetical protein ACYCWW_16635 [Deltaproteobacteria bacterium]